MGRVLTLIADILFSFVVAVIVAGVVGAFTGSSGVLFTTVFLLMVLTVAIPRATGVDAAYMRWLRDAFGKPLFAVLAFLIARIIVGEWIGAPLIVSVPGVGYKFIYLFPASPEAARAFAFDLVMLLFLFTFFAGWQSGEWGKRAVFAVGYLALAYALLSLIALPVLSAISSRTKDWVPAIAKTIDSNTPTTPDEENYKRIILNDAAAELAPLKRELARLMSESERRRLSDSEKTRAGFLLQEIGRLEKERDDRISVALTPKVLRDSTGRPGRVDEFVLGAGEERETVFVANGTSHRIWNNKSFIAIARYSDGNRKEYRMKTGDNCWDGGGPGGLLLVRALESGTKITFRRER